MTATLIERLTPDFSFADDRGLLVQLVHGGYTQVNAVFTKKGAVRGRWHYHAHTREVFFVLSGSVRVSASKDGAYETAEFKTGDMFAVGEYVRHNFEYLEDTCLTVLYTRPVEAPDGARDILTDPAPPRAAAAGENE